MRSFRLVFDYRARLVVAAAGLLLATIVPTLASAAQLTSRSIELSSASKDADNVTYAVHFTTDNATATAVVIEFCENSPLYGATCDAPTGFKVNGASATGWTRDDAHSTTDNKITLNTGTTIAGANTITLTGVNNPTDAGHLYARIATYASDATGYTTADPDAGADHLDDGAIAMDIVDSIGVSAAVLETMTFCVSGEDPDDHTNPIGAACSGSLAAPSLTLGETTGDVKALDSTHVSTADVYTQISTNAVGGAVVSLKSGVACGGLKRANASTCDIAPALTGNIVGGQARFGVVANADSAKDAALTATGTYQIKTGSGYSATDYALNYNSDTSSGVTSAYGDPILDTGDTPTQPSNKNMKLTFGASIAPNTPAGLYKGDLSLIATGTF